jgi:hypothetical protein
LQPLYQRTWREFARAVAIGETDIKVFVGFTQRGVEIEPIGGAHLRGCFSQRRTLILQLLNLRVVQ